MLTQIDRGETPEDFPGFCQRIKTNIPAIEELISQLSVIPDPSDEHAAEIMAKNPWRGLYPLKKHGEQYA